MLSQGTTQILLRIIRPFLVSYLWQWCDCGGVPCAATWERRCGRCWCWRCGSFAWRGAIPASAPPRTCPRAPPPRAAPCRRPRAPMPPLSLVAPQMVCSRVLTNPLHFAVGACLRRPLPRISLYAPPPAPNQPPWWEVWRHSQVWPTLSFDTQGDRHVCAAADAGDRHQINDQCM